MRRSGGQGEPCCREASLARATILGSIRNACVLGVLLPFCSRVFGFIIVFHRFSSCMLLQITVWFQARDGPHISWVTFAAHAARSAPRGVFMFVPYPPPQANVSCTVHCCLRCSCNSHVCFAVELSCSSGTKRVPARCTLSCQTRLTV